MLQCIAEIASFCALDGHASLSARASRSRGASHVAVYRSALQCVAVCCSDLSSCALDGRASLSLRASCSRGASHSSRIFCSGWAVSLPPVSHPRRAACSQQGLAMVLVPTVRARQGAVGMEVHTNDVYTHATHIHALPGSQWCSKALDFLSDSVSYLASPPFSHSLSHSLSDFLFEFLSASHSLDVPHACVRGGS